MTALRRNMLACPDLKRLDSLLARHRLTEMETGQVVLSALKVELSKVCLRRLPARFRLVLDACGCCWVDPWVDGWMDAWTVICFTRVKSFSGVSRQAFPVVLFSFCRGRATETMASSLLETSGFLQPGRRC